MKLALKTMAFVLAASTFAPAAFADTASDGKVDISGVILQNACTVKSRSVDVQLKDEYASIFTAAGQTQGDKAFEIELEGCDSSVYSTVQVRFEGVTVAGDDTVLANTSDAEGVGVQILDSANSVLTFNNESAWSAATNITAGENTETAIPFTARYISTDATVKAGQVETSATFYLQYN